MRSTAYSGVTRVVVSAAFRVVSLLDSCVPTTLLATTAVASTAPATVVMRVTRFIGDSSRLRPEPRRIVQARQPDR